MRDGVLGSRGLSLFSFPAKQGNCIRIPVLYLLFQMRATTNSSDQKSQLQPLSKARFPFKEIFSSATFWHNIKST